MPCRGMPLHIFFHFGKDPLSDSLLTLSQLTHLPNSVVVKLVCMYMVDCSKGSGIIDSKENLLLDN